MFRGASKSSTAAPRATASAMARGDSCGVVFGTLASTNQEKAAYVSEVCKGYFSEL